MIDGLKITVDGSELRAMLKDRIEWYERQQRHWEKLAKDDTDDDGEVVQMPQHICENEAERCEWRAEVLGFIHDHLDPSEIYRLSHADMEAGELLPERPGWMEQEEYEATHPIVRVSSNRSVQEMRRSGWCGRRRLSRGSA